MTSAEAPASTRDETRARHPDRTGFVERDGVRVHWEEYGSGEPVILFVQGWSIVHARVWKAQIHAFARHARVLTFDARGNGRSDRPVDPAAYTDREFAADILAVLDAAGVGRAYLVGWSLGVQHSMLVAAEQPERVAGLCLVGPGIGPTDVIPRPAVQAPHFLDERASYEGWEKFNAHYWSHDLGDFAEFFAGECVPEPHSTKQIDDMIGWALNTTPEVLAATFAARAEPPPPELWTRLRCPVMVVTGTDDRITPFPIAEALAEATGARLLVFDGGGHSPPSREPVRFNLELRQFVLGGRARRTTFRRAVDRPRRALYVSSPIGLGHAWRDVAIARELRRLAPDLQIDWLAQPPVTRVLQAEGERIHEASRQLASEAVHIDAEVHGHELDVFEAYRRMDEILIANFMVFHDLVEEEHYDLWIGDEAWELDHFLHENPECKRAPYVWLSDYVGFLPMPEGGQREALLTADYNAEMLEHIARFPWVRDRSLFVGNPDDVVPDGFGPGLPAIRPWAEEHFDFTGHISGFDAASSLAARDRLRAEVGYAPDERICLVSAGGSAAGESLLRRAVAAHPRAAERIPGLRTVVVAGPRIDPTSLDAVDGVEVVGYVHDLRRRLAACDLAIVHGGLATTMELAATRRPFLYFPLKRHFEQQRHVHHRLQRYGAGRCMEVDSSPPEAIADAMVEELSRPVRTRPVETDGARRAAELIAQLL